MKSKQKFLFFFLTLTIVFLISGCSTKKDENTAHHQVEIVTSTNIYANIAKQIVGKKGRVHSIISNGNTDPHDFEPTTGSAKSVAKANIVIANGLGYDDWMIRLAAANNVHLTKVGEQLMGLKIGANPHIWYNLKMPAKYAHYIVVRASEIDPDDAAYFKQNEKNYLIKINRIKKIAAKINGKKMKPVYVSEPVFDYALKRCAFKVGNRSFEEAVENETDPSAQVVHQMQQNIKQRKIAFFVNNVQASSSTVNSMVKLARKHQIPVLKVRETMPNGISYYQWMKHNYEKLSTISAE